MEDCTDRIISILGGYRRKHVLHSPVKVRIAKTLKAKIQDFILNLNFYRAAHHRTIDAGKSAYEQIMEEQIIRLPKMNKVFCIYTANQPTRRRYDIANVCAIHEKFFMDALTVDVKLPNGTIVRERKLPDDSSEYCIGSTYLQGIVNKKDPHVEIVILEV